MLSREDKHWRGVVVGEGRSERNDDGDAVDLGGDGFKPYAGVLALGAKGNTAASHIREFVL